jgi:uncharacterized membrane protein
MRTSRFSAAVTLAALTLVLVCTDGEAAVTAKACNQSTTGTWVGFGYYVDDTVKWVTTGWWWADPNECTESIRLRGDVRDVYVYANTQDDDVEWQGTKSLCVSMDGGFEKEDAEASDCPTKRSFKKYGQDASGNLTVTLRDEESVRVAYDLRLCNKTDDYVSVALGNTPETGQGVSADGWYGVESGQCQTYIRRGKSEYAYFFAQTPGRRLAWYGNEALCTRYHESFALASADSIPCQDGDSERLPFTKAPLARGVGSYDLTAEGAHAFKSGLNLCNGYKESIYPAIAHLDGIWMNGVVARGFWVLHPGECKLVDAVSAGQVYLYAETDAGDKTWGGNDLKGCVREQGFTLPRVDGYACKGEGERRVGFFVWTVSEGANVYKFE